MRGIICPRRSSENIVKNGNTVYGGPEFMCGDCRKQFVGNSEIRTVADEKKEPAEKMFSEKIPPAGICQVPKISQRRLQSYAGGIYQDIEKNLKQFSKEKSV